MQRLTLHRLTPHAMRRPNLGRAAAGGADDVAGMAAQVLSLGQAIKAGLGPIGWAMMMLEGVQAAWNAYSSAVKAHREAMEVELRIATEINEAQAGLAKRQQAGELGREPLQPGSHLPVSSACQV